MTITKINNNYGNFTRSRVFEKAKMSNMSNSDRVAASREAKRLVLEIYKIYKKTKSKLNGCNEAVNH
jgi:hypothetical protein